MVLPTKSNSASIGLDTFQVLWNIANLITYSGGQVKLPMTTEARKVVFFSRQKMW